MKLTHITFARPQAFALQRLWRPMLFAPLFISTALAAEPDYVSTRDLAEQFGLKEMVINDETVRLESRTVSIHLTALKNDCELNALTLALIHPVARFEKSFMVSKDDAEQLFKPILQPESLKIREPIRLLLVVGNNEVQKSDSPEVAAQSKWVDMIAASLVERMPRDRIPIAVKRIKADHLDEALAELPPADLAGVVLVRMQCEGKPEYPITAKTFAPAVQAGGAAGAKPPSFDSIALASAIQGSVGVSLGGDLRNGRFGQAQLPELSGLGFPAVKLVLSPPDTAGKDDQAIALYAKAFAVGVSRGIVRFNSARTN